MDRTKLLDVNYARILVDPRVAIREIVDRDPRDRTVVLITISGFIGGLAAAMLLRAPEAFKIGARSIPAISAATMWKIRLGQVIGSPFLAVAFLYINGSLLRWSGGLLGGTAKSVQVRAALGWSSVPSILSGLVVIAFVLIHPPATVPAYSDSALAVMALEWPQLGLMAVLGLYVLVISLKCIAEVHRFSAWRALAAWVIERLLLAGAFIVLAIAVPLIAVFLFR